ncbi:MAG TPA: hypothetical protein VF269_06610 [Rhodanobacteraceae bacterium]
MLNVRPVTTQPDAVSMHHDLWVELACIEMRMECLGRAAEDVNRQQQLELRSAELRHAMACLPA